MPSSSRNWALSTNKAWGRAPRLSVSEPNGTLIIAPSRPFVTRGEAVGGRPRARSDPSRSTAGRADRYSLGRAAHVDPVPANAPRRSLPMPRSASHRLLVRAGYVRRVATGGFSWLPLGGSCTATSSGSFARRWTPAGFQEVPIAALLPREPYEISNRWEEVRTNLLPLRTARRRRLLARPEEMFAMMVTDLYGSYRDLHSDRRGADEYRDAARPVPD